MKRRTVDLLVLLAFGLFVAAFVAAFAYTYIREDNDERARRVIPPAVRETHAGAIPRR